LKVLHVLLSLSSVVLNPAHPIVTDYWCERTLSAVTITVESLACDRLQYDLSLLQAGLDPSGDGSATV